MKKIIFLTLFTVLVGTGSPVQAQNKYFEDFQDTLVDYPDIPGQRLDYYQTYQENRRELDLRRNNYEQQRQDAAKEYNQQRAQDQSRINYDAGVANF